GTYVLDKTHASLTAKVSHMGLSSYTVRFDSLDAHYDYDPASPAASQISVTVDANSLDVGDGKIAAQFAKQFLGADRYPQITFVSTGIQATGPDQGVVTGNLTLNGVTKSISLAVTFNGCGPGLLGFGGYRMGFSATGDIKRSDFGSRAWLGLVGDEVHLVIEAEFSRK
ncbi:MAG: YceI family protein, partial [Caulobacteraceae bacterium]|nr:YceI family protein [Caulobacteraceae bacterium]